MQIDRARMYRVKAVAEMLDVSVATVYRAIESGALDVHRFGKAVRVPGHAIELWLKTTAHPTPSTGAVSA